MSEFDAIKSLEDAGVLAPLPESHNTAGHGAIAAHRALATLSPEEVTVLASIRDRMAAEMAEDVEAHVEVDGTIFW